jgi:hypothetical protein
MRTLAILALAACTNAQGDDFPITTQGGGTPGGGGGSSTTVIIGRVCVLTDPRSFTSCLTTGAGNLTVTVGKTITTTATDGTFTITTPAVTIDAAVPTTITVTGVGIIPSAQTLTPAALVPALREELFASVLAANGIVLTPGSGSILTTVVRNGQPVSGVTAISTPSPAFGPFFDGTTPTAFTLNGTGASGVVFFPGFTPTSGGVNLTFTDAATSTETTVGGVQVINGGITFTEGILP